MQVYLPHLLQSRTRPRQESPVQPSSPRICTHLTFPGSIRGWPLRSRRRKRTRTRVRREEGAATSRWPTHGPSSNRPIPPIPDTRRRVGPQIQSERRGGGQARTPPRMKGAPRGTCPGLFRQRGGALGPLHLDRAERISSQGRLRTSCPGTSLRMIPCGPWLSPSSRMRQGVVGRGRGGEVDEDRMWT
jgi:hypothetical protein